MFIRHAKTDDLDEILRIYDAARATMRENGNDKQWVGGYPGRETVAEDIAREESYLVCSDDGIAHGVFMFAIGADPTYAVIEDGAWPNDEPYGVIHRIGSDGQLRGVLPAAVEFATGNISNIRIDTHADNSIMHHVLEREGFIRCGIIYCNDGTPRVAYQLQIS